MEENQSDNGSSRGTLDEDALDEDETRLIIDEGCLPSQDSDVKLSRKQKKSRNSKVKSKKGLRETTNSYPCPECGKQFRRKVKLQAHLSTHKSKEELECENCGKEFLTVDLLFDHVCSGIGNTYKCAECDESFRLKRDLRFHQQSHMKVDSSDKLLDEKDPCEEKDFSSFIESFVKWPISCTHCGVELANLEAYNVHMVSHKEGKPCVCLVCKMKFLCQDDYVLHKAVCRIEGIFECTQCSQRFHTEEKLCEHLESHKGESSSCDVCGVTVESKDVASHKKAHKTNIFVCGKCKKIFNCNNSFQSHTCISESSEKKLYTFAAASKKKMQCQDSLSDNGSDSDEAEFYQVNGGSYSCKACKESFEDKQDFVTHLKSHFKCTQCKKYFKTQMDLDMHTFLLADEKLYSCYLCESYLHGKRELERHLSEHVELDNLSYDDLDCEESNELLQNVIPSMIATNPLHSLLFGRSGPSAKINKVVLSGSDALKCSSCGKSVLMHRSLSNIKPNTPLTDPDEEYFYISRLGIPQNKQSEETCCECQQNSSISAILNELSPSKSVNESESQDAAKVISKIPIYLPPRKVSREKSCNVKSKSLLGEKVKKDSVVQLDMSNGENSNSNRHNNFEILKSGTEVGYEAPSNPILVLNSDAANSSASSTSDLATKKDCKIRYDGTKSEISNTNKFFLNLTPNSGIKVFKYINKADAVPSKADTKQILGSTVAGDGTSLSRPVKITVSTGMLTPVTCFGSVSELLSGINQKKVVAGTKRPHAELRVVNQEELMLPSSKRKDVGKGLQENTVSASNKFKEGNSLKPLLPVQVTTRVIAAQPNGSPLKTLNRKNLNVEAKSLKVNGEKRNIGSQSAVNYPVVIPNVVEGNLTKNTKSLGNPKEPVMVIQEKYVKSPKKTPPTKKEQVNYRTMPDSSTPKVNESEISFIPDRNMVFKVEKPSYESEEELEEEEEEEEEASLAFSGIKKEFLASDVFIKEEEWDIVDF